MKSFVHILPVTGLLALMVAGCQTQQNPAPQTVSNPQSVKPTTRQKATTSPAATPVYDPINDPSTRDSDNGGGGGGGPSGGGGGSWG